MRKKIPIIIMSLLMIAFCFGGFNPASADSVDVTTQWIVGADTTITDTYPAHASEVEFQCSSGDFVDQKSTGQAVATPALKITNDGNTAVQIEGRWTSTGWSSGIEYVNMSIDAWDNVSSLSYTDANELTNQTWVASLAISAEEDFWFWTTGHGVVETSDDSQILRVYSSNV